MQKEEYCLYSYEKGYLVKRNMYKDKYSGYWFSDNHIYDKNVVRIFTDKKEAEDTLRHWIKFGHYFQDEEHRGPVPDARLRIAGTDDNLPLPEDF